MALIGNVKTASVLIVDTGSFVLLQDYREMQNSMIYGQSPSYDDLIAELQELNKKINSIRLS